jgi:hypothetical protein
MFGLPHLVQIVGGTPDQLSRTQERARGLHGQIVLPYMHPIGIHGQDHIGAVVHDEYTAYFVHALRNSLRTLVEFARG